MNINDKYNMLTYIELIAKRSAATFYKERGKFRCDCGNETITDLYSVEHSITKSCGCLSRKHMQQIGLANPRRLKSGESTGNYLYHQYKSKAKHRNLVFEISKEEFFLLTQQHCFYCHSKPSTICKIRGGYGAFIYNGLDRLINSKGYVKENVVSCCPTCNFMKAKLELDVFMQKIFKIAEVHKQLNLNS